MANIIVLGAGMVGSAIAQDLAARHKVTLADINEANLSRCKHANIKTIAADLKETNNLQALLIKQDLAVNALPGHMAYSILETLIRNKINVVDISFFPEDPLVLAPLVAKHSLTVLVDMGVAPGLSHLLLGHYNQHMKIHSFECLVGGLPKIRVLPFEYKAPFSPADVIEEYTRPARIMRDGQAIILPALSDCELVNLPPVGSLEAFNTDGLRTLLSTMKHIPNMKEKTLRYPGHCALIKNLQQAGFFQEQPLEDTGISPREFTQRLLRKQWQLEPDERELTLMRVTIQGQAERINVDLYDETDVNGISSMARTTGYTCNGAVELLLSGKVPAGLYAPEQLAALPQCFESIINYLNERNIRLDTIKQ